MADLEDISDELAGNLAAKVIWDNLPARVQKEVRANMTITEEQDFVRGIKEAKKFLRGK